MVRKSDFALNARTNLHPMNTSEVSLKEVELLTVRVLDGLHEPKDMDRLSVLLRSCPVARSRYAELVIQDSLLHWETSEVLEFETSEPKTVPFPKMPLIASFAAAILAIFGFRIGRTGPLLLQRVLLRLLRHLRRTALLQVHRPRRYFRYLKLIWPLTRLLHPCQSWRLVVTDPSFVRLMPGLRPARAS